MVTRTSSIRPDFVLYTAQVVHTRTEHFADAALSIFSTSRLHALANPLYVSYCPDSVRMVQRRRSGFQTTVRQRRPPGSGSLGVTTVFVSCFFPGRSRGSPPFHKGALFSPSPRPLPVLIPSRYVSVSALRMPPPLFTSPAAVAAPGWTACTALSTTLSFHMACEPLAATSILSCASSPFVHACLVLMPSDVDCCCGLTIKPCNVPHTRSVLPLDCLHRIWYVVRLSLPPCR